MLCHGKKIVLQSEDFADSTTQDLGPLYERLRFFGLWLGGTPLSTKPLEGLYSLGSKRDFTLRSIAILTLGSKDFNAGIFRILLHNSPQFGHSAGELRKSIERTNSNDVFVSQPSVSQR